MRQGTGTETPDGGGSARMFRQTRELLRRYRAALEKGDPETLRRIWDEQPERYLYGVSQRKWREYSAVIHLFVLSQAALDAGAGPAGVCGGCQDFFQRVSLAGTSREYEDIVRDAAAYFTGEIRRAERKDAGSLHVQKCKRYVAEHLHTPFSQADAARELGVTPAYLSALFSRNEHMTLKEYILRERVREARRMLRETRHSIAHIADSLCFCSQSHFTAVFRKYAGMTPSACRAAVREREETA